MKKFAKNLLTILLIPVLIASCGKPSKRVEPLEDAKQILEKTSKKYGDLLKKDGKGIKTIAAKISVKGGAQLPMGEGGVPLDLDAAIDLYAVQPHNLYLSISGNLGNATIIVAGEEKKTATIMLPGTKQFAIIEVPENIIEETQEGAERKEPPKMEDLWKEAILTHEGVQEMKAGKAHKIKIEPKDPSAEGSVTVYILDGKWDPARLELNTPEGGKVVVEFEELELNAKIPDEKFVPNTQGYTQISDQQLTAVIMMQVMTAMMQQGAQE